MMFKKLLIISISVFVLAGCGEKEPEQVTEEMLIGNWNCQDSIVKSQAYDSSGNLLINNDDLGVVKEYSLAFTKDNGLVQTMNNDEPMPINFKIKTVFDFMPLGDSNKEVYADEEYIFVSKDQFKIIVNLMERDISSKQKIQEDQYETLCTRQAN